MALLEDIQNTKIQYAGITVGDYPTLSFNYRIQDFDYMIHIRLVLNKTKSKEGYSRIYYNRGIEGPIISTGDVRWILKKLYND